MKNKDVKKTVKKTYSKIATGSDSCCSCGCTGNASQTAKKISKEIGYSDDEMDAVPEANLGLGCGNPTAMALLKEGERVLDLGADAGFDCFLAANKVGKKGKVTRV